MVRHVCSRRAESSIEYTQGWENEVITPNSIAGLFLSPSYGNGRLPYGTAEYIFHLPEGWELRAGSFFELDFSFTYDHTGIPETQALPPLVGDIIIVVDGETRRVFSIEEASLEHFHLRVDLPPSLLNDPTADAHSIEVTLDTSLICTIPHRARLIIHPISFLSLSYNQLPVNPDLALYPRPFYQQAFKPDQVRFVLPDQPTEAELAGAMAVAAKLGQLTQQMAISGTTDLELMNRLEAVEALHENLIVIGRPETNGMILRLNHLGALPVPLRERQLSLASEGPVAVAPGSILTYTLMLTNTTPTTLSSLSLVDTLPAYAQVVTCSPSCAVTTEGEVSWSMSSLRAGEALSYMLELRLSEVITDSMVENTVALLDSAFHPINVNTLTTTVSSTSLPESGLRSFVSSESGYFFLQAERAVPENDGIVQELVSPWDQTRAILVITGLSDEAVHKASQAMSSENRFPGLKGPVALVREVRSLPEPLPPAQSTDLSFADLGYGDNVLEGYSQEAEYFFDIPYNWRLTKESYLDLHFSHSQPLNYSNSFLNVLFNYEPVATIALSEETSLGAKLKVELPISQARPGQSNSISIQTEMHPWDECSDVYMWLLIRGETLLHLDHKEQNSDFLDLGLYPYPFDQRSDLADVLFVLPPEPQLEEWEQALRLAAALGSAAGGPSFAPGVALGDNRAEAELIDYHLVIIGRPSRNLVLQQVNAQLPQPFLPNSDLIEQKLDEVIQRLPPDVSLGYVQLIPSPWIEERALLAVTGTRDEGVTWATRSLVSRPWDLEGNLALIRDQDIKTLDTRTLTRGGVAAAVSMAVPELTPLTATTTSLATTTPMLTPPPTPTMLAVPDVSTTVSPKRPVWLFPLVVSTAIAVLAIFAFAVWQARKQRR
jgi:uncharacterized repeat protein (TIGR01451 family)